MSVESAVENDIKLLGPLAAESALAATALALARGDKSRAVREAQSPAGSKKFAAGSQD